MKLVHFQVQNFRSINDSRVISVDRITTLVGRNESGKSNLLLALASLNPPGGPVDLSPIKDFPKHRRISECKDDTPVLWTTWELTPDEQNELSGIFPRASNVTRIEIGRRYKATLHWVKLIDLPAIQYDSSAIAGKLRKLSVKLEGLVERLESDAQAVPKAAIAALTATAGKADAKAWASAAKAACDNVIRGLAKAGIEIPEREETILCEINDLAVQIVDDANQIYKAREWALDILPTFVYVEDYPELTGHQNIADYMQRKGSRLTKADNNFEKMCKVAGLDPAELHDLLARDDHETRSQLANRAGAVVTTELRRLWRDRKLKVRFSPDGNHLDTLISDENATYDIEVNLDDRSRGLKWFFSFYIAFSADTKGGEAEDAIMLLDEPGLYLHALSQGDLVRHLESDFKNQIVYTTHSPFMVPSHNIGSVRTVNISQDAGTTVTNTPTGDSRTLFPLQAALGYSLAQSLFVGTDNLVVEGVTDFWILSSVDEYLKGSGKPSLPATLTLTPAGGAQKINYMVALLSSEQLRVVVLFDDEGQARATRDDLVKNKLIREDAIIFASAGFPDNVLPAEADIEDLIEPGVYDAIVAEAYATELQEKTLSPNPKIPRIVKRYDVAFRAIGLEFNKVKVANLFMRKMATDPASVLPQSSADRFEKLFAAITAAHAKAALRNQRFR